MGAEERCESGEAHLRRESGNGLYADRDGPVKLKRGDPRCRAELQKVSRTGFWEWFKGLGIALSLDPSWAKRKGAQGTEGRIVSVGILSVEGESR